MILKEDSAPPAASEPPLLLQGGTLLTLDAGATVLRGADLLIREGRIASFGAPEVPPDARVLDVSGCLVLPGLIQGHIHLGQTFFRGLAEERRLLSWLRERIWPLEAAHDDESAYWCSLPEAMRLDTDAALAATEALGDHFEDGPGGRLRYVLNPRFVLTCSDPLWVGIRELASRRGWPVHTHALEQRDETLAVRKLKGGRDEIEYFADQGVLATDLRIAHGVWITGAHLNRVREGRFSVVHCPSSNLKLGSGIADLLAIRRTGVPVGIGTDATACSNQLDNFAEVRLAALLQKVKHGPDAFSGLDALRLATSEGARALNLQDEIGTIEPGKRADLVVLAAGRPELWAAPQADPHDLVAFGASRATVRHVLIAGRLEVEDGRLTRLDLAEIYRQSERHLGELIRRSGIEL